MHYLEETTAKRIWGGGKGEVVTINAIGVIFVSNR